MTPFAEDCLNAVASSGLAGVISLGGAFGLLHYLDYRSTHDVDAWWSESTSAKDRDKLIGVIRVALAEHGEVRVRSWGEIVSIELLQDNKKTFSFQIAERSVRLRPAGSAGWTRVPLDSLEDLVASKMVALVERGAPRDFRDIYALCENGIVTAAECWSLWRARQSLAGENDDSHRALLAVETHLARIERQRPLPGIVDPDQREAAASARAWYKKELVRVLVD